jgi:uncharacterized protein
MADTTVNTFSGGLLDFTDPSPQSIELDDIGHGLSFVPRFGAQALAFRSVAQHAVFVSEIVARLGHRDLALAALHHDSHEAYACDIPSPLKGLCNLTTGSSPISSTPPSLPPWNSTLWGV